MKFLSFFLCALFSANANDQHVEHAKLRHIKSHHHSNSNKRVVGGQLTDIDQYPYQVAIEREIIPILYYRFTCGGSIISEQHILTAAHCIFSKLRVKLGTSSIFNPFATTIDVDQVYKHPNFKTENRVAYNDIAVLKLKSKITFSKSANKIDLPAANSEPKRSTAVLTGWGLIFTFLPLPSFWLMKADVLVISNDQCAAAWDRLGLSSEIRDTNLCTLNKDRPRTACSGDSGGPLAQDGKIIGVVSWGVRPCEMPDAPSVYTKVSMFVDWIKQQLTK